jgi:hypothetical protein
MMQMTDLSPERWRKSSHSGSNGCVEVELREDRVAVRDSKNRSGPVLLFTPDEWKAFLAGAQEGEFELPA